MTLGRPARTAAGVLWFVWNHPSNQSARLRAVARAGAFQFRGRMLHKRTLAPLGQRSRIWADLHRAAASRVVYANPPDHPEMLVWTQRLGAGELFIDVGANVGAYSIWAGELGAEVIALEPAADTFALLEENVALNGYPITALNCAAGSFKGTARFTTGADTTNRFSSHGSVETTVVVLDDVIGDRSVGGIKIDVEGFELEVLLGCKRCLADRRVQLIQLEWNSASAAAGNGDRRPVADLLARYGYELCRPDRQGRLIPISDARYGPDVFALAIL